MKNVFIVISSLMTVVLGISMIMLFGNPKPVAKAASEAKVNSAANVCTGDTKAQKTLPPQCETILD